MPKKSLKTLEKSLAFLVNENIGSYNYVSLTDRCTTSAVAAVLEVVRMQTSYLDILKLRDKNSDYTCISYASLMFKVNSGVKATFADSRVFFLSILLKRREAIPVAKFLVGYGYTSNCHIRYEKIF